MNGIQERLNNSPVTNDIAYASTEVLETEMQNRYFSRYLESLEAHGISGR